MAELFWPFDPKLVIEWPGERPAGWAPHIGTDWPVAQGTPLRAAASGVVDIVWNDGYGAWIINIICSDGTVVRNGHLSHMAVNDGQWVKAGDYIGNTGGAIGTPGAGLSTGSHLHWEIRTNNGWGTGSGDWYDPRNLRILTFGSPNPSKPAPPATSKKKRGNKMDYASVCYLMPNKNYLVKVFCLGNGEEHHYEVNNLEYINNIAKTYQCGPNSIITKSHYDAISKATAATRKRLDAR